MTVSLPFAPFEYVEKLAPRCFVDLRIADRQNVDSQNAESQTIDFLD
jgi:hypothetical protein